MIVIAAVALYGAALGLSVRPAIRAVLWAALSIGAAQYGAIWLSTQLLRQPGLEGAAGTLQAYAGSGARDLVPTVSTAVFAAMIAALASSITRSSARRHRLGRGLGGVAAFED